MQKRPGKAVLLAAVALAAFLALFRAGWTLRAEADARNAGGQDALSVSIIPWLAAKEHDGAFPLPDVASGRLMWKAEDVRPAYVMGDKLTGPLDDPTLAIVYGNLDGYKAYTLCPLVQPQRYYYLGYAVTTEAEGLRLLDTLRRQHETNTFTTEDIPFSTGTGSFGSDRFYRLREDVAATVPTAPPDLNARVPLIIEQPGHYPTPGAWVVYLDRHCEYVPYPGPFPMTKAFVEALAKAFSTQ